ncbi:MAG: DedA family protein [Bdellovibrionota bacterium]|nr:MAG: DedA family protein [Bdellovibrionota bacterium]
MEYITQLIDLFVHLDKHLHELASQYGIWATVLLIVIVFCETGLVVTPFLPGDSLLFAAGALAASGFFEVEVLLVTLFVAAVLGDGVNYHIGKYIGPRVFQRDSRWIKRKYLERTQRFYEKYGGKTIIIARFVPIVRTFAPFLAGVGTMHYSRFLAYNIVGAFLWVFGFILAGYFFGNIPVVKNNFSLVILGIIIVSILPAVFEVLRAHKEDRAMV